MTPGKLLSKAEIALSSARLLLDAGAIDSGESFLRALGALVEAHRGGGSLADKILKRDPLS